MLAETLVINATDIRDLVGAEESIDAVANVLARQALGQDPPPLAVGLPTDGGGFHIKAAAVRLGRHYFASKTNGNFPANPARHGLPTVQGVIVLCDADDGRPLAVLDTTEVTALRTAAATAVAARHLARRDSAVLTLVGCGRQGRAHVEALKYILPLERILVCDADRDRAERFAREMSGTVPVTSVDDIHDAARRGDVVVTCTPSRGPLLHREDIRPGTFVAGVGADHPEKQELDPGLFRDTKVVVDSRTQCLIFGDLHHAVAAGAIRAENVHAELGEVVAGAREGRASPNEITIFDSTGTALQDVAVAAIAYERAVSSGRGIAVCFAG